MSCPLGQWHLVQTEPRSSQHLLYLTGTRQFLFQTSGVEVSFNRFRSKYLRDSGRSCASSDSKIHRILRKFIAIKILRLEKTWLRKSLFKTEMTKAADESLAHLFFIRKLG